MTITNVVTCVSHFVSQTDMCSSTLQEKLVRFILACQDEETGGFADRPGDMVGDKEILWVTLRNGWYLEYQ